MMSEDIEIKAPQDVIFDLPQEALTGDVLKGRGPRRGNLERLLRYWRPIMRKPGGFRRCRVILANHPELYPLERICAWLHHETTGLWPNEGCHHPGMKNCKGKLKKRNMSNSEFSAIIRKLSSNKKSAQTNMDEDIFFSDPEYSVNEPIDVVTEMDFKHAMSVLSEFMEMEKDFTNYLRDTNNWEIYGEDNDGQIKSLPFEKESLDQDCCSGELEDE
jgi:hypothetical protein